MKKLIILITIMLLAVAPAIAEAPNPDYLYSTDTISFSVVNTYLHQAPDNDFIIIEFLWRNQTSEPISFNMNLLVTGYQNGKELSRINYEPDYDTDLMSVETLDRIMPGYENTNYEFIPLKDNSEVTIVIDQAFEVGDSFEDITYTVMPSDLSEFKWPEE